MKKITRYFLSLTLFTMTLGLSSCQNRVEGFEFDDYKVSYNNDGDKVNLDKDEGMVIDGYLDEEEWEIAASNAYTTTNSVSDDVNLKARCYLGEKGVYFGVEVNDYAVFYNEERKPSRNSSVEVHFKGIGNLDTKAYSIRIVPTGVNNGVDYKDSSWRLNLNGTGAMQWMTSPFKWEGAALVKGNINTSMCEGYTCEAFVPWSVIGVENHKYLKTFAAFNHVESESMDGDRIWAGTNGCLLTKPNTWKLVSNSGLHAYEELDNELVSSDFDMKVDGVLDEASWSNVQSADFKCTTKNGAIVEFSALSYMTSKGAYFGFDIKDKYVFYADESIRPIGLNSGMEILFAPYGVNEITPECLQLRITANNIKKRYSGVNASYPWSEDNFEMLSATTIHGELNSKNTDGYTIEIFIPWTSFGTNSQLDGVMVCPSVVHAENSSQKDKTSPWDYCNVTRANVAGQTNPQEHFIFMDKDGAVLRKANTPNIFVTPSMLVGDYYEYDFNVTAGFVTLSDRASSSIYTVEPEFEMPNGAEIIKNADGTFKARIDKNAVNNFVDGVDFDIICNGGRSTGKIYFAEISVDGNPNEQEYGRTYTTNTTNATNKITQNVKTVFGKKGIFVGFDVYDSIIKNNTHVETFFNLGEEIKIGNTWQIRCYPFSNTYKTYVYTTPDANGWAWQERAGDERLHVITNTVLTNEGYGVEIFIPYETFGLEEAPDMLYMLPCVSYYKEASALSTSQYHNENGVSNTYTWDRNNYVAFSKGGYVSNSINVDDIYLTDNQLVDGKYTTYIKCLDDQNNFYRIKEIYEYSDYFKEVSDGIYKLNVSEEDIHNILDKPLKVKLEDGNDYEFKIILLGKNAASAYVDFNNGQVSNSGKDSSMQVSSVVLNKQSNATAFNTTSNVTYTEGIDGDQNGAILTNHRSGAYTNISGCNFGTNDFTVSTWINVPEGETLSTGNSSYIFGTDASDSCDTGFRITLRKTSSGYYFDLRSSHSGTSNRVKSPTMSHGEWHSVILVRNVDKLMLYIDGELLITNEILETTDFTSTVLNFGAYIGETWSYSNQKIAYDNIAVYNNAITEVGIKKIFENKL